MEEYEKYHPDHVRSNLVACAFYIALYESFTDYVIEEIKSFYLVGLNADSLIYSSKYAEEVKKLDKSPITASLKWLNKMEAISVQDIENFSKLRSFRNKLAHEMVNCIFEELEDFQTNYNHLVFLRRKIEVWWILNIEIPTNPDFDGVEIIESEIVPPSDMMNKFLFDILTGDKETSEQYYNEMKRENI